MTFGPIDFISTRRKHWFHTTIATCYSSQLRKQLGVLHVRRTHRDSWLLSGRTHCQFEGIGLTHLARLSRLGLRWSCLG